MMNGHDVIPIGATMIDWDIFVRRSHNYLGRSPTRTLDAKGMQAGPLESYIAALGEFQHKQTDPHKFLALKDSTSAHLSFTFLCMIERELYIELLTHCAKQLTFTRCEDLDKPGREAIIVTGTLEAWSYYIINYLKENYNSTLRDFLHHVLLIFEKIGFKFYFANYRRVRLTDASFILEER